MVLIEPPSGWPRNSPEAILAIPCALKSPFPLVGGALGSGTVCATPNACTRMMMATAAAPVTNWRSSRPMSGSAGNGSPRGIEPESET